MRYLLLLISFTLFLPGCQMILGYKPNIQQGNILTPEDMNSIHKGMSQLEVINKLGDPILVNVFNRDTYDYVYSYSSARTKMTSNKFIIKFVDNQVSNITT